MTNGHLKVLTQGTVKYSYPPEGFIMIVCVVDYVRYWKRLSDNILKTELFLLRSFHMMQPLYLIILKTKQALDMLASTTGPSNLQLVLEQCSSFKVDRESCYCAFLLRIKII